MRRVDCTRRTALAQCSCLDGSTRSGDVRIARRPLHDMSFPWGSRCSRRMGIAPCAGLDKMRGTLRAIQQAAPKSAACPECRQRGVFTNAVLLKKLGLAIQQR